MSSATRGAVALAGARRSDYDITNTVRVSSPHAVMAAVEPLLVSAWPQIQMAPLTRAFHDFDLLSSGRMPGYAGVDTVYHDRQHTLDVTLAMARLLAGYERQAGDGERLGAERGVLGIVLALFHDVGYLRRPSDDREANGAEFTRSHVSRGADFLRHYLRDIDMAGWTEVAAELIHFTGYERALDTIVTRDARDRRLGQLLGTADMIAQLADRCYLEKCRDRLYPEFVLGGVAVSAAAPDTALPSTAPRAAPQVRYASGLDLLRQTPGFVAHTRSTRLDGAFERAYRYLEPLFDGRNPYIESIDQNMRYLEQVLRSESWRMLRRRPPIHAAEPDTLVRVRKLMLGYLKRTWLGQ